jgi:hypothetical protein
MIMMNETYNQEFVNFALNHSELSNIPFSDVPIVGQTVIGIRNLPYDISNNISKDTNGPLSLESDKISIYRCTSMEEAVFHSNETEWCAGISSPSNYTLISSGPLYSLVPHNPRWSRQKFGFVWAHYYDLLYNERSQQFPTDSFIRLFPITPKLFHKLGKFYNRVEFTDSNWVSNLVNQAANNEPYVLLDFNYMKIFKDFLAAPEPSAESKTYIRSLTSTDLVEHAAGLNIVYQDILLAGLLSSKHIDSNKIYIMTPFESETSTIYNTYINLGV